MKSFFVTVCILICSITFGQTTSFINNAMGLPDTLMRNELRIYRKYQITNGTDVLRLYKEKDEWRAEFYNYYDPVHKDDTVKFDKVNLRTINLEDVWDEILATNVHYIHDQEEIKYKLQGKQKVVYDNGQKVYEVSRSYFSDGVSYNLEIKNNSKVNVLHYSNPEAYLRKYPDVDELQAFVSMLEIIKNNFNVWNN